jgi:phage shock protein C
MTGQRRLYRSRQGAILGVCRGVADYLDFPVFWLRVGVIVAALMTAIFPAIVVYVIAGLIMQPEPVGAYERFETRARDDAAPAPRRPSADRLRTTYEDLDCRVQRIETVVTSSDFDWKTRMDS